MKTAKAVNKKINKAKASKVAYKDDTKQNKSKNPKKANKNSLFW